MKPIQQIHVVWEGPMSLETAESLHTEDDYGLYQVYGGHVVYGSDILLYIGKAGKQTIGQRLRQEKWWREHHDTDRITVYVGRLSSPDGTPIADRERAIDLAERLLIFSHSPAYNAQKNIKEEHIDAATDTHVFNWCNFRDLLPEVSGQRWTSPELCAFERRSRAIARKSVGDAT